MGKLEIGKNDLQSRFPEIAKQAHGWDPSNFCFASTKKVLWKCSFNHIWEAKIHDRTGQNSGCHFCSHQKVLPGFNDLASQYPEVAKQAYGWDPSGVLPGSGKKKLWICPKGHIWESSIKHRKIGRGCPSCAEYGFNQNKPAILYLLYHPEKELHKIGIMNEGKTRIQRHILKGWVELDSILINTGKSAFFFEQNLLRMISELNIAVGISDESFDGYTETFSVKDLAVLSFKDLVDQLKEAFQDIAETLNP